MQPLTKAELAELMEDAKAGFLPPNAKELAERAEAAAKAEQYGHVMQAFKAVANGLRRGDAKIVYDFAEKLVNYYLP
jgi:hypothetical protein